MSRIAVLALALAALAANAAVTNEVDVAALVAAVDAGISETNGWTLYSGLGKYNANCIKFDTKGDWIRSPDFGAPIIGLEATVRCSSTSPTRLLHVLNGETDAELETFAPCGVKDKLEAQLLEIAPDSDARCVKLKFDGSGNTGVWGIGSLKVITADPIAAPTAIAVVKTNTTSCVLEWVNGANTVSNRIDIYLVDAGIGDKVLYRTDFDGFYGNATTTRDFTESVPELLGDSFSGIRVYGAAGMSGICQLGTSDAKGFLRHAGLADYSGVKLCFMLKRYETKSEAHAMQVAYETDGATNVLAVAIDLPDAFAERECDLSSVPSDSPIIIGYYSGVGGNRRVLIDSLSIVRSGAIEETLVDSRFIPAASGEMRFSTRGAFDLVPNAGYRFEVSAQSGEGLLSSAISAEARLLAAVPGFGIILR